MKKYSKNLALALSMVVVCMVTMLAASCDSAAKTAADTDTVPAPIYEDTTTIVVSVDTASAFDSLVL